MNVVALGTGTKSMISLWLLNPASLARRLCLLRLTKKTMNPIVQASRTQAPETDPAIIGVLAFSLDYNGWKRSCRCQHTQTGRWNQGQEILAWLIESTHPWRTATSEGFSARAACWIGGVPMAVVVKDEETLSLRKMLRRSPQADRVGHWMVQDIPLFALYGLRLKQAHFYPNRSLAWDTGVARPPPGSGPGPRLSVEHVKLACLPGITLPRPRIKRQELTGLKF